MSYPRWCKSKRHGHIIKFAGLNTGIVVVGSHTRVQGQPLYAVGYTSDTWADNNLTHIFEPVQNPISKKARLLDALRALPKEV